MTRKTFQFLVIAVFGLCLSMATSAKPEDHSPVRILLIGNSIIYTNNLSAMLASIAFANGHDLNVDMYAKGGATVLDHVKDPVIQRALGAGGYKYVVFHDRGGDALCAAEDAAKHSDSCKQMIAAHMELVSLAHNAGALPYLLGTYQGSEQANLSLAKGEQAISREVGVPYINVSVAWLRLRDTLPSAEWLAKDGVHPGPALSVLIAAQIYKALFSESPEASDLHTKQPLYVPRDELTDIVEHGELVAPNSDVTSILPRSEYEAILDELANPEE